MPRVLVGAPVRRKPRILRHFLQGLEELDRAEGGLHFLFVDDNDDPTSSALLRAWRPPLGDGLVLVPVGADPAPRYDSANDFHRWTWRLTYRVAAMRNAILDFTRENGFSHALLVDSDLVLRPDTLHWLLAAGKDIVAEVFWTKFFASSWRVPNAWLWGDTAMFPLTPDEDPKVLTREEIARRTRAWFRELRTPGVHEVAGTGACILVSRAVLEAGVSYAPVPGLGWWGEDRFFQVRSAVAGYRTYVDTHAPPLHLYRDSDLKGLARWRRRHAAAPVPV